MHLELRETMARVGADIKQKIIDTFKSVYNFASLQKNDPKMLQQEVDKVCILNIREIRKKAKERWTKCLRGSDSG